MASQRFDGHLLRRFRVRLGYSRANVAIAARRSEQTIVLYELGKVVPPVKVVEDLAVCLEVDPGDLFTAEPDHDPGA